MASALKDIPHHGSRQRKYVCTDYYPQTVEIFLLDMLSNLHGRLWNEMAWSKYTSDLEACTLLPITRVHIVKQFLRAGEARRE